MVLPASPSLLLGYVAAFFVGLTLVSLGVGFLLERLLPGKRVWALPLDEGQLGHELRGNLVFLGITIATFTLTLWSGVTRFGEESWARGIGTYLALNFGFQAFYYGLHRLMHTRPLVRFHRYHHVSRVTTPLSGQSTSAVEALGWMLGYVGMPVAMSYLVPISALGWGAYMAYNVFGNIVGHANCEVVPPGRDLYYRSLLGAVFTYHALHHARWTGHYSFASSWADRLFGSEWDDWIALHAKVWSGHPLRSLKERADGAPAPPATEIR